MLGHPAPERGEALVGEQELPEGGQRPARIDLATLLEDVAVAIVVIAGRAGLGEHIRDVVRRRIPIKRRAESIQTRAHTVRRTLCTTSLELPLTLFLSLLFCLLVSVDVQYLKERRKAPRVRLTIAGRPIHEITLPSGGVQCFRGERDREKALREVCKMKGGEAHKRKRGRGKGRER